MRKWLLALLFLSPVLLPGAEVEVTVEGIDEIKGTVLVGFFTNQEDFRENEIDQSPSVELVSPDQLVDGKFVATATDLEPGWYAVAVIWDWNQNGVLDTKGPLKFPTEPYGFSLNPKIRFGPPKFDECKFEVTEEGGKLHIVLIK